jgi:hypothetical protein
MQAGVDVVFVEDLQQDDAYRTSGEFRQVVDSGGYRSLLRVALRKEAALLGVIGIFRKETHPSCSVSASMSRSKEASQPNRSAR